MRFSKSDGVARKAVELVLGSCEVVQSGLRNTPAKQQGVPVVQTVMTHPSKSTNAANEGESPRTAPGEEARSLRTFFEGHHARLTPGLRRMLSERTAFRNELTDELLQRVWTLAWQALQAGKYDSQRAAFSTFVYAIAHHVWLQHLRAASQGKRNVALVEQPSDSIVAPEDAANMVEQIDLLRRVLRGEFHDALSDEERWILRAVAQGETDRGLAAKMKLSPSTANARKASAFDRLRRLLAAQGHRQK